MRGNEIVNREAIAHTATRLRFAPLHSIFHDTAPQTRTRQVRTIVGRCALLLAIAPTEAPDLDRVFIGPQVEVRVPPAIANFLRRLATATDRLDLDDRLPQIRRHRRALASMAKELDDPNHTPLLRAASFRVPGRR